MFSFICVWINGWVNNREAADLRRNRGHYDVIVMPWPLEYMLSALTAELPECDTSQFMVWDTGSGDIDILFVKANIWNVNQAWATAPISTVNNS